MEAGKNDAAWTRVETVLAEPVLETEGLGVAFGPRVVLADINLTIAGPGITVLMGPGGTGKSTLLHRLAKLPASNRMRQWGTVRYLGQPLDQVRTRPALVHQQARDLGVRLIEGLSASLRESFPDTTSGELRQIAMDRLDAYGLTGLKAWLDTTVADLSPVDIRQASLLRAAFSGAPLMLIDEPTSGLGEDEADRVLALIEQLGREHACLVTLHNQRHARRIARWAVLMAGGRIQAAAAAAEFFANPDGHPVLAQFLRTGSCSVPAPDSGPEQLAEDVPPPPPLPQAPVAAAIEPSVAIDSTAAPAAPEAAPPEQLLPTSSTIAPRADAPGANRGPQGFHWLIPGRLAGCPMPGVVVPLSHDLALLRRMGVTMLINLTERNVSPRALQEYDLKSYGLRIEDRQAPPLMWAKLLLTKMETFMSNGEVLAVHCLAGLGRTGTILCAWLIREGLTADEALRRLRRIDPGFVQSKEQEDLLHELEANLLVRMK